MAQHDRLYRAMTNIDPDEIVEVFGSEYLLDPPDPSIELAPVKRVAIVAEAFFPKIDGVSKSAFLTLRYLQQTGREVLVFAPDIAPAAVGPSKVIRLRSFGFPGAPETRVALPGIAIGKHMTRFQPDVIHLFSPALMSVSGLRFGLRHNIPVVANYQTDLPGYTKHYNMSLFSPVVLRWLRYIHNHSHLTLGPSNSTLRDLRSSGYRRLRRWGRGVDSDRFNPAHRTDAWRVRLLHGRDPESLLCLYVGRLATEKRVELLLDVAKTPGVALTIIGDGAQRDKLESIFAGTDTYFTGYLFGDDLAHAYASGDVFLFTGENETFGQVIQEAMASGLPAIVINQGGVVDLVEESRTGYICPPDPREFASAVRTLRDDPALRLNMAHRARAIAESNPWEAVMAQLETYYREAVEINQRLPNLRRPSLMQRRPLSTLRQLRNRA
jgi:phosphatidylinositol alpha 1,6-mannosyltransferase